MNGLKTPGGVYGIGMRLANGLQGCPCKCGDVIRMRKEMIDRVCQRVRVVGGDESAIESVGDVIHRADLTGGDDGFSAGHGFEHDDLSGGPEGVVQGKHTQGSASQ